MNQQIKDRNRRIIRYSLIGVGMNLLLAVMKMIAGTMAHSHAIVVDGVNSLSDMATSVISILSSVIAGKRGNQAHPFGYGRLEYLSSLLITAIILNIGFRAVYDSVKAILHPHNPPHYNMFTVAVVLISVTGKLAYGLFMRKQGRRLNSAAIIMSAVDSMGDALISAGIRVDVRQGIDV